ncbi:MAG: helix-turn-helix domain-containing protein [Anaerolineae bacterium]
MDEAVSNRAKTLGGLIRDARINAGRTIADCADILKLTPKQFEQAEAGEYLISLPDLEALALYLSVPMGYFWGSEEMVKSAAVDYVSMLALRHRLIGVLLRQLKLQARTSTEELARVLGVEPEVVEAYETGEKSIPYVHLEQLSAFFGVSVDYFVDDQHGPLGRHEAEQKLKKQFHQLSPEMQAFILNPVNITYLETARRLSEMDVEKLRLIAESILEITF